MYATIYPTDSLKGHIQALPSKNYTTRYLLAAALAKGTSEIENPAYSQDSSAMVEGLKVLGAKIEEKDQCFQVTGFGSTPKEINQINPKNAGAVLRFLMGTACLTKKTEFLNTFPTSLGKRPHLDLINALQCMGAKIDHNQGKLPIIIEGGEVQGGQIKVSGKVSSQFLSSLLFLTPLLKEDSTIEVVDDLKSKIVISQTLDVLEQAEIRIEMSQDYSHFFVLGNQMYLPKNYTVEGDYPGSSAILCAAAITHSDVTVERLRRTSKQGERAVVDVLAQMGVQTIVEENAVRIQGNSCLRAVEYDGDQATDAVLAMVAASVFAKGTSRFYNIENLRYKESDRISDFVKELKKAGADVLEKQSEIIVHGKPEGIEGGVTIDSHFDHRIIMALSILALRSKKAIMIRESEHISKSYPNFFEDLIKIGGKVDFK